MNRRQLGELPARCFGGSGYSVLATCSADGVPNATWLSRVFLVDDRHVALACQFHRKSFANLETNPRAQVLLVDPATADQWRLDLMFVRSQTEGATLAAMRAHIEAITSRTSMEQVFALRSADVFEVLDISPIPTQLPPQADAAPASVDPISGLARLSEAIAASTDLASLIDSGLAFLDSHLGYDCVSLYVVEETEGTLYALASRGFPRSHVGARIPIGVGVVGTCARHLMPIRIANTTSELRYCEALAEQLARVNEEQEREIALPGLEGVMSLVAVPLLLSGKLFGVLASESTRPRAFDWHDAQVLATAGQLLAQGIALHREDEGERDPAVPESRPRDAGAALRIRYYEADDSVFVDDEYLIKGLPGRILWLLLTLREAEGRSTFLNRELRLHPFLKLPPYKDNLETRLLMLQRRLDEKGTALRLHREQRGRLRLECEVRVALEAVRS